MYTVMFIQNRKVHEVNDVSKPAIRLLLKNDEVTIITIKLQIG